MIYKRFRDRLLDLLKAPKRPPDPPAGSPESVQIFRAAPNFLKLQVLMWGFGFAVGLIGEIAFVVVEHTKDGEWVELGLGYVLFAFTVLATVVKYFLIRLDYDMRYYIVTDRSLRIREGAIFIHESTFTYANVQNLRILQGPVERLLGLSNLVVETAGGAGGASRDKRGESPFRRGHQGVLRGVANARAIRDQILSLLKRYRDAGLGDPEDQSRAVPAERFREGFSPAALARLREIRNELRSLSESVEI